MTIEQMKEELGSYCMVNSCGDCRLFGLNNNCRCNDEDDESIEDCYHFLIAEGLIGKPEQPMRREELVAALKKYCDSFGKECDGCEIESVNMGCAFERKSYADLKRLYDIAYPKEINFIKVERNDEIEQTNDAVNHPNHYCRNGVECIDIIKAITGDGFDKYCVGTITKYLFRWKDKNGIEDLRKAQRYLNYLIEEAERTLHGEKMIYGRNNLD